MFLSNMTILFNKYLLVTAGFRERTPSTGTDALHDSAWN